MEPQRNTVCGQLAGAHWGLCGIPSEWAEELAMAETLRNAVDTLAAMA